MLTTQYQSLSSVEEYILTVLDGNELYGLDILSAIASGSSGKLNLGPGTLYPTLRRLEKEELVHSRWGDQEEGCGGARRKYYRLTSKGAVALGETQKIRAGLVVAACKQERFDLQTGKILAQINCKYE